MELLSRAAFEVRLRDEWNLRYARQLDPDIGRYNLSIDQLYPIYRDYRGRVLARLSDSDEVAAANIQRFNAYRDRVDEITEAAAKMREMAETLAWLEWLRIPMEIPKVIPPGGMPLRMIEPTSIPHTLQMVRWLSPFGPDKSPPYLPPYAGDGREERSEWVIEFEHTIDFLNDSAKQIDWAANEIRRKTTGQQDNADRRAFRLAFATMIAIANPGGDAKADNIGAAIFTLVWGDDIGEASYRAMRHREEKARRDDGT